MHVRFYAPDANAGGDVIALPAEEAEHAARVLRLAAGDEVVVFNGRGQAFDAAIESIGRNAVSVRLGGTCTSAPEAGVSVMLVQAVLKADKMDDVIRDAVMIGVAAILPIVTSRTEVGRSVIDRSRKRERWRRIAVSSAKQCGRAVVPPVFDVESFDAVVASGAVDTAGVRIMLVEPGASGRIEPLPALDPQLPAPHEAAVIVGPEGGWTAAEVEAAERSCRLVTLGGRTLRADAMALVGVTALFTAWGEYAGRAG